MMFGYLRNNPVYDPSLSREENEALAREALARAQGRPLSKPPTIFQVAEEPSAFVKATGMTRLPLTTEQLAYLGWAGVAAIAAYFLFFRGK